MSKMIYFSFIHNYVNYCNIAWVSTSRTKYDKILKTQKHVVRIIYNKDKFTHSKLFMRDMNALNVSQINIFQVLKFIYKSKHNLNPRVFANTFTEIHHGYPAKFSRSNFKQPKYLPKPLVLPFLLVGQRFRIITYMNLEKRLSQPLFLHKLKIKLLESGDELTFF